MALGPAAIRKLGSLAGDAERTVAEMIRERGGSASNVRMAGHWANRTLGETATAAVAGDASAKTAIKIVKDARRLGDKY